MPEAHSLQRFEFIEPHMGTSFGITLYAAGKSSAEQAAKAAFARVAELNRVMSDYVPESELMFAARRRLVCSSPNRCGSCQPESMSSGAARCAGGRARVLRVAWQMIDQRRGHCG